jgi:Uma2 family endonuclease
MPNQPGKKPHSEGVFAGGKSAGRQELLNGQVVAKSASNRWHNLIATNIAVAIGTRIQGNKAEIYVNGMRVQLGNRTLCYPDVTIVSGEPIFADSSSDLLMNPTTVIEVFSSATNPSDKTQKLEAYLALDSIKECLQIKADEMRVEHFAKQNPKQWIYRIYNERDDVVTLDSINLKLSVAEIYSQIKFRNAEFSSTAVN